MIPVRFVSETLVQIPAPRMYVSSAENSSFPMHLQRATRWGLSEDFADGMMMPDREDREQNIRIFSTVRGGVES